MTHHTLSPEIQRCIEVCKQGHDIFLQTVLTHCLQVGGKHVEEAHFRLMINCAEICQTSANFMLRNSLVHEAVCVACAEVCDACTESCECIGDMDDCAQRCRRCAD